MKGDHHQDEARGEGGDGQAVLVAPWAPLMMAMPRSQPQVGDGLVPVRFSACEAPLSSQPTSRQLISS